MYGISIIQHFSATRCTRKEIIGAFLNGLPCACVQSGFTASSMPPYNAQLFGTDFRIFPRPSRVHAKYRRANSPDGTAAKSVDFSIARGLARIRFRPKKQKSCARPKSEIQRETPYHYYQYCCTLLCVPTPSDSDNIVLSERARRFPI